MGLGGRSHLIVLLEGYNYNWIDGKSTGYIWISINYHQLSSIIINYHQLSSIIINYHQLSSISHLIVHGISNHWATPRNFIKPKGRYRDLTADGGSKNGSDGAGGSKMATYDEVRMEKTRGQISKSCFFLHHVFAISKLWTSCQTNF